MNCLESWPEPIVRVQALSESGLRSIPAEYVKPPRDRPAATEVPKMEEAVDIPAIDLQAAFGDDPKLREETTTRVLGACREWGFFQVVNHGVSEELMRQTRQAWREFFTLPVEEKQQYANSPTTYEGYGSRIGVEKGAILDWCDYFFLHLMPLPLRNPRKWPSEPSPCRALVGEYGEQVLKLCGKLMKILSLNLGLEEDYLQRAFGGNQADVGACLRVNYYPKCPQPDLTLGLSPHSDPGGMTILLPDHDIAGLQVLRNDDWVTIKPYPNAFIVNIGDQIQVLSNAIYKSVEHRVIVNSVKDRMSLAFLYNPKSDLLIEPVKELVTEDRPALYEPMTFDEYRLYIRTKGPCGKAQVDALKCNR